MFFTFPLPSQKKALDYFEKAVRMLNGKFILGGHSKGAEILRFMPVLSPMKIQEIILIIFTILTDRGFLLTKSGTADFL